MSAVLDERITQGVLARAGDLIARVARHDAQVHAAQRLRLSVFSQTYRGRLHSTPDGRDEDRFDAYCRHLVVEDARNATVVGTYRLLMPEQARALGAFYMDSEFLTQALDPWRDRIVELGRSCVHPGYRSGGVILLLWSALGELLGDAPQQWLVGCASVPMADGGRYAATLYRQLSQQCMADESLRVQPKQPLDLTLAADDLATAMPPPPKRSRPAGRPALAPRHRHPAFICRSFPLPLASATFIYVYCLLIFLCHSLSLVSSYDALDIADCHF